MTRLRPVLLGVTLSLVLVGCGAEDPATDVGTTTTTPPQATSEPAGTAPTDDDSVAGISDVPAPKDVPELLEFTAKTIDGEVFEGRELFGAPAVLWFWAPWCPTCQAEAPTIAEAAKTPGVRFVGVAAQDQVPAMRQFVDRFGLGTFPHIADTDARVWKRFDVTYQPAYAFVSSTGEVETETDLLEPAELLDRVRALE